jgi:hypothetical protein
MQMNDPTGQTPDDVPEEVISQAKAAFARRTPGPIAVLAWDSLVDEGDAADDHRLVFDHPDVQIEVRVRVTDRLPDLEGRVKPPGPVHVELQSEQGDVLQAVEATDGIFILEQAPRGVVRLTIRSASNPEIRTDWFRI